MWTPTHKSTVELSISCSKHHLQTAPLKCVIPTQSHLHNVYEQEAGMLASIYMHESWQRQLHFKSPVSHFVFKHHFQFLIISLFTQTMIKGWRPPPLPPRQNCCTVSNKAMNMHLNMSNKYPTQGNLDYPSLFLAQLKWLLLLNTAHMECQSHIHWHEGAPGLFPSLMLARWYCYFHSYVHTSV